MTAPVALYRCRDASGRLLYAGVSAEPLRRAGQHAYSADWAGMLARIDVDWFQSRAAALAAEAEAIRDDAPLFNDQHSGDRPTYEIDNTIRPKAVRGACQVPLHVWRQMAEDGLTPAQAAEKVGKTAWAARKAAQIGGFKFRDARRLRGANVSTAA